jgi:hypothetical protein
MGKITDRIDAVEAAMKDPQKKTGLANLLKNAAIDAITNGVKSEEWKIYMSMFADSRAQLNRLTTPADSDPAWLRESRAYIVSNSICAINTNTRVGNGVSKDLIDGSLSTTTEEEVLGLRPADLKKFVP